MAVGPLLPKINDGDALLASKIRTAFASLQNFLGSFPVDNLERFKTRSRVQISRVGTITAAGAGIYTGYQELTLGGGAAAGDDSKVTNIDAYVVMTAAMVAGDDVTIKVQTASTLAGAWADFATLALDENSTNIASDTVNSFGYHVQSNPGTTIVAGKYWRVYAIVTGAQNVEELQVSVEFETRLQP